MILFLCLSLVLFSSCGEDIDKADEEAIQAYIANNNLSAEMTAEGIYYIIETEGSGSRPNAASSVEVDYEGFYLDGEKFDSSYDRGEPSTFRLNGVIEGWTIGIPLFKEGGKGTLIIPSRYAYGSNPPSGVRKDAPMLFNIELLEVF